MAKKRTLKDTVKDPMVKKENAANQKKRQKSAGQKTAFKIVFSLLLGFAGGLLTGRFIRL